MSNLRIDLDDGTLELILLNNGQLVLGKYSGKPTSQAKLTKALKQLGITYGYIDKSLKIISNGSFVQMPVAQASIMDEPGKLTFPFQKKRTLDDYKNIALSGRPFSDSLSVFVQKNQELVKLVSNPHRVLKLPNGKSEILEELTGQDLSHFSGENTYIDKKRSMVLSKIDGVAYKDQYGMVAVYPQTEVKSIGKAHGKIYYEAALFVKADIRSESNVETLSDIFVNGMIRSSQVSAAGNVHAKFGLDNHNQKENSIVTAGQTVVTSAIRNFTVWAGEDVLASSAIYGSNIKALNVVATPKIKDSEIRAGGKIFTRNVEGKCRFFLGAFYVKDTDQKNVFRYIAQHKKRLDDLDNEIYYLTERLNHDKVNIVNQINKLKRLNGGFNSDDLYIKRFYNNQVEGLIQLKKKIKQYEEQIHVVESDQMRLSYYENQFIEREPATLFVEGNLPAGTIINAPGETVTTKKDLYNITIFVDPVSGKIITQKNN